MFRKRTIQEFRLYQYLRIYSTKHGGHLYINPSEIASRLNISLSTFYRHFAKLRKWGWVLPNGKKYLVISILRVRKLLGIKSRAIMEVPANIITQGLSQYRGFLLAGYTAYHIRWYNKTKVCSSPWAGDKDRGEFALSLMAYNLGFSKATASRIRKVAIQEEFLTARNQYDEDFGLYPADQVEFLRDNLGPEAPYIQVGWWKGGLKAYLRSTDLLLLSSVLRTRQRSHAFKKSA